MKGGAKELKFGGNFPMIAIRYFNGLLGPVMMRIKRDFLADYFKKFSKFFREVFSLSH